MEHELVAELILKVVLLSAAVLILTLFGLMVEELSVRLREQHHLELRMVGLKFVKTEDHG